MNSLWRHLYVSKTQIDPLVQVHLWFLSKAELQLLCCECHFTWQEQNTYDTQLSSSNSIHLCALITHRGAWWECKSPCREPWQARCLYIKYQLPEMAASLWNAHTCKCSSVEDETVLSLNPCLKNKVEISSLSLVCSCSYSLDHGAFY